MDLIVCTWITKLPEGRFAVWPDGCRDLIAIVPKSDPATIVCSGLDAGPRQVLCDEDTFFVGVRLAVGVTFPWEAENPCSKHDDQIFSQIPLFGCHERGSENDGDETLEKLVSVVNDFAAPAPSWVSEYIQEIQHGEVRRALPLSERSIRRKLADTSGAPPRYWKSLARVRQAAMDVVRSEIPLVILAIKHGFSDQAHMSREIRRWFGVTPATLRTNGEQFIERLSAPDVFQNV
ncbi:helix-turn-helix domain-containing protein [Vreelandella alkaliphila]|uniref:helix-turn-helix domain-containing protein n=1 Tax=Halomonadaceae TaxID=28256 RepID=UPI000E7E8C7E|nr:MULTISPECIES: helix-turn-helix domain-containing protein [unclassified Halomonas]WKD29345.1 helix-turn-helix domain-containing protein [Halomonas sp. KG2]HBP40360.1 AraC family transcriptional regulator [Halomonas sp.]